MEKVICVIFTLAACFAVKGYNIDHLETMGSADVETRAIRNGYNAPYRPFFVVLMVATTPTKAHMCGGTLISRDRVASAAHCFPGNATVMVLMADFSIPSSWTRYIEATYYVHENYNPDTKENDIAYVTLRQPVPSLHLLPICSREKNYTNSILHVVGMGILDRDTKERPEVLQEVELRESLERFFSKPFSPLKQIFGVGDDKDSCLGDSGGPMFPVDRNGTPECLYGIVSYGASDCSGRGIYTRASYYDSWLTKLN